MILSTPVMIAHDAIIQMTDSPPTFGLMITRIPNRIDSPPAT